MARTGMSVFLVALLACGCARGLRPAEPIPAYFQDAGKCSRENQFISKVKVRADGFRDDMPVKLGANRDAYQGCMESLGWVAPDPAKDPYFELSAQCRQSAERRSHSAKEGSLRINIGVDAAAYRECMHEKGAVGEVIVHPLQLKR